MLGRHNTNNDCTTYIYLVRSEESGIEAHGITPDWICESCPHVVTIFCQDFKADGSFQLKPPGPYAALTCNKLEHKGRIPITWHHIQTNPQIGGRAHSLNLHVRFGSKKVTYTKTILAARVSKSACYIYANIEA
jgi:hypothetical protein